jgi:hypothetical protein
MRTTSRETCSTSRALLSDVPDHAALAPERGLQYLAGRVKTPEVVDPSRPLLRLHAFLTDTLRPADRDGSSTLAPAGRGDFTRDDLRIADLRFDRPLSKI